MGQYSHSEYVRITILDQHVGLVCGKSASSNGKWLVSWIICTQREGSWDISWVANTYQCGSSTPVATSHTAPRSVIVSFSLSGCKMFQSLQLWVATTCRHPGVFRLLRWSFFLSLSRKLHRLNPVPSGCSAVYFVVTGEKIHHWQNKGYFFWQRKG